MKAFVLPLCRSLLGLVLCVAGGYLSILWFPTALSDPVMRAGLVMALQVIVFIFSAAAASAGLILMIGEWRSTRRKLDRMDQIARRFDHDEMWHEHMQ